MTDPAPALAGGAHLARMVPTGNALAPAAPVDVAATGVDGASLLDLALKAAYTIPQFSTE